MNRQDQKEDKRRIKTRIQTGFHRGGDEKYRTPFLESCVYSKRNGKWRRDIRKTVEQLVVVFNRIEHRRKKKESVILVGTTDDLGPRRERVFMKVDSKKRIRVSRTWISGILTNYTIFRNDRVRWKDYRDDLKSPSDKRWYENHRKGREGFAGRDVDMNNDKLVKHSILNGIKDKDAMIETFKKVNRPGLIRFMHPNDHTVGIKEALRCGIPTAGIVNTDGNNTLSALTYPIPGNDKSRRSQLRLRRIRKNLVTETAKTI